METADVRYTRSQPEEWNMLIEAITPNDEQPTRPISQEQATKALEVAYAFETESLEAAAYYGWGLGIRGLAKVLHNDDDRQRLAAAISTSLTARNRNMTAMIADPDINAFNALTQAALTPVMDTLRNTYKQLPASEHLASDALTVATRAHRGGFDPLTSEDGRAKQTHANIVRRGDASATIILSNATAGSIIVHSHARAAREQAKELSDKQQNLVRFAVQSAALHTEEFQGALYADAVTYYPDGIVALDRSKIPEQPELPDSRITDIKHEDRLGCPAIQVQFAIPGMLQLILDVERHQTHAA